MMAAKGEGFDPMNRPISCLYNLLSYTKNEFSKRKEDLHISVSDKGGEFVVMDRQIQKSITEHHINSMCEKGVYKFIPPSRGTRTIAKPTEYSYSNSIASSRNNLESEANTLWSTICEKVSLDKKFSDLFISRDSNLPTMYILIKTHKTNVKVRGARKRKLE